MVNNFTSAPNTIASDDNGGGGAMNAQPKPRPVTRSTRASKLDATASASNQPNAHASSQFQGSNVDLTSLDGSKNTKDAMGMWQNNQYLVNNLGQPVVGGTGGVAEQNLPVKAVLRTDSETSGPSIFDPMHGFTGSNVYQNLNMAPITKFESQAPEPANTIPRVGPFQTQSFDQANTATPLATPAPAPRPSRGVTEAPEARTEHVPPNRIAEAGPVPHPDPNWRPYGTNHWYIFITSHETLKYLSTSEIKGLRDHCYQLSKGTDENGNPTNEVLPAPDTAYTSSDARLVWKYCDAYIRRRSQLRNNTAARRSRQRKEAETRYWKQKALDYGCPDHDFVWDEREVTPTPSANAYTTTPSGPRTRARARQCPDSSHRGQLRATAARSESVAAPEVAPEATPDFNRPMKKDDAEDSANFEDFAGFV